MGRPTILIKSFDITSESEPSGVDIDISQSEYLDLGSVPHSGESERFVLSLNVTDWNSSGTLGANDYYNEIRVWLENKDLPTDNILIGFTSEWSECGTIVLTSAPMEPTIDAQQCPESNVPSSWDMTADPLALNESTGFIVLQFQKGQYEYPSKIYGGINGGIRLCFDGEHS